MPKGRWKAGCKHQPVPLERPGTAPAAQPGRAAVALLEQRTRAAMLCTRAGSRAAHEAKQGSTVTPRLQPQKGFVSAGVENRLTREPRFKMVPIITTLVLPGAVVKLPTLSWGFTSKRHTRSRGKLNSSEKNVAWLVMRPLDRSGSRSAR